MPEDEVKAVRWKVLEGQTVELYYDSAVFRRVGHLLVEEKAKEQEKVRDIINRPPPKYPPLTKIGEWLKDPVAMSLFEDHQFKVRSGVVDGMLEFLSTGFRTRAQLVEWFEDVLTLKHASALIYSRYYTHYLDTNAKIETRVIDGQDAYRMLIKEQRFETPTI